MGLDPGCCARRLSATVPKVPSGKRTRAAVPADSAWEIWNEQNIVTFADPVEPLEFAKLIRISGRVLHRIDPGAKVILGGFFGRPLQVRPNAASGDYLSRLYRARDVKPYFDGVALHPYVARAGPWGPSSRICAGSCASTAMNEEADPSDRAGVGVAQRPNPLGARPPGVRRTSSRRPSRCSPAIRVRWGIGGAWWFTWTDEGGGCLLLPLGRAADRKP